MKQHTKEMQAYLQRLLDKRMADDPTIKGYVVLPNGAIKLQYNTRPDKYARKALATNLGNSLRSMKHVRVCHNTKG